MAQSNGDISVKTLNDLKGRVNEDVLEQIRMRHKWAEIEDENYLTDLQKKVFSSEDFWEQNKNIIVRGRTSSGKTMVAEIAAAYFGSKECLDADYNQNKIIYLVPLRAMVAEKRGEFKDIFEKTLQWKVYASSSDYQDHDEDIIQGKFKIAVMVYEKFFALLAQDNNFINQCSLIVVDELQMLGVEERGAKLEVALTKIIMVNPQCKIIGLTTLQCDTVYVKTWLNASEIECNQRPKTLYEYLIWPEKVIKDSGNTKTQDNMQYQFYGYLNVESNDNGDVYDSQKNMEHKEGDSVFDKLIAPDFTRNNCEKSVVPDLVECVLKENKDAKIIVFINNKNSVEAMAKILSQYFVNNKICERKCIDPNDERIFDLKDSEEENVDLFLDEILPQGIAYHHGGLSRTMRDFVEEEFRKSNGYINIVIATETLAIGVNMPADVVILVGVNLPRGGNRNNTMKSPEYKNCIGRAGRLGINSAIQGKSYLIATSQAQANDYWERYIKAKPVNIMSYMLDLSDEQKAPYMLNLVQCNERTLGGSGDKFELREYGKAANKSFVHYCTEDNRRRILKGEQVEYPAKNSEMYKEQLETLESVKMLDKIQENEYETTKLGNILARYALSISTVKIIVNIQNKVYKYLEEETDYFDKVKCGLNNEELNILKIYEAKNIILDFFDKYFLDILFELCTSVEAGTGLDENIDSIYTNSAMIYLGKNRNKLLKNGSLYKMLERYQNAFMELPNQSKSKALKNAILLYEWSMGTNIKLIRKKTGLSYAKMGDVDRLGDVVAYLWEAMAYSFQRFGNAASYTGSLAKMSGRIKYGVPNDIILLASRHIPYLSREQLMKIRIEAEKEGIDPISYVRNMRNINKTSIPARTFKALSKSMQVYYGDDNQNLENTYLYKKELISYEARKVLDNFEDRGYLIPDDFICLFSNESKYIKIQLHSSYVEICGIRPDEKVLIYFFNDKINNEWIKSTYNEIEKIKKGTQGKIYPILLLMEPFEKGKVCQFSYKAFAKLYKYSLQRIGNLNPLFDILTMECDLVNDDIVEAVIEMYTEQDTYNEVYDTVHAYMQIQGANSVDIYVENRDVVFNKSNITSVHISEK